MTEKDRNRFALLDDREKTPKPLEVKAPNNQKPTPDFNDGDWQEVKARGAQPKKPSTLAIRDENKHHHSSGRRRSSQQSHRQFSSGKPPSEVSIGTTYDGDKQHNPFENWCGVCNLRFANKSSIQSHVKQMPNHQNYCNLCKRVFKDRNGLKNHVDHAASHDVFCNLCLSAFNDKWGLKNHFENNYSVGHEFACLTCLLGFRTQEKMEVHLGTAPKHVGCTTCRLKFRDQEARDRHWVTTKEHRHCLQPGCDFDCSDAATLGRHVKEDHFLCEGCHTVFPSATRLNHHLETCGLTQQCPGCQKQVANYAVEAHRLACFPCKECPYWTDNEVDLLKHGREHTLAVQTCYLCFTPMQTNTLLMKHLETGKCPHVPDPAFLTRLLGKWWYSVLYMDLDIHAQIRQGRLDMKEMVGWMKDGILNPYMCRAEGCSKTFSRFSSLVFHVESGECRWGVERLGLGMLEKEVIAGWKAEAMLPVAS